jgi:hypothetical protein
MNIFKHLWVRVICRARDEYDDTHRDIQQAKPLGRALFYALASYGLAVVVLGCYWSIAPSSLNLSVRGEGQSAGLKAPAVSGVATSATLIALGETLLNKPGGLLSNDIAPPGVWQDDMPQWELGVLLQLRDHIQVLSQSLSQSSLNHELDRDLQKAEVRFNFSHRSWGLPAAEAQYRAGIEYLQQYQARLLLGAASDAHFYADAQHLNDYLAGLEPRLKKLSQRLSASIGPNAEAEAAAVLSGGPQRIVASLYSKTSWWQIDDVFYEARGSAWALLALLSAVEVDFSAVLQAQSAQGNFAQIIRELKPTQDTLYSPVVLNGDGFGVLANHSLTMASYLARTQAAIADCRRQLLLKAP